MVDYSRSWCFSSGLLLSSSAIDTFQLSELFCVCGGRSVCNAWPLHCAKSNRDRYTVWRLLKKLIERDNICIYLHTISCVGSSDRKGIVTYFIFMGNWLNKLSVSVLLALNHFVRVTNAFLDVPKQRWGEIVEEQKCADECLKRSYCLSFEMESGKCFFSGYVTSGEHKPKMKKHRDFFQLINRKFFVLSFSSQVKPKIT